MEPRPGSARGLGLAQPGSSPFKGQGYRQPGDRSRSRAAGPGDAYQTSRARVQRQRNEALVNPADLRYAEWKWEDDEVEPVARILLQHMRTFLDTELSVGGGERGPTKPPQEDLSGSAPGGRLEYPRFRSFDPSRRSIGPPASGRN